MNLVPGALAPVFDHLQYAEVEREGLGDLIMCNMTSILHKVDTWGTVPNCYSSQTLL